MGKGILTKRFASTALPFAAAMAVVAAASGCDPTPRPQLSTSAFPLLDGEEIRVSGYGYAAGVTFDVLQCPTGADAVDDCNQDSLTPVTTNAQRRFEATTFVDASFQDAHGATIDCHTDGACEMTSLAIPGLQEKLSSSTPLEFSGRDGLTVTPNRDLTDGQTVVVRGRASADFVKIFQCPSNPDNYTQCDQRTLQVLPVQDDGTFQTEMTLHRQAGIHAPDCTIPGGCMLASDVGEIRTLDDFRIKSPQWTPLEFD